MPKKHKDVPSAAALHPSEELRDRGKNGTKQPEQDQTSSDVADAETIVEVGGSDPRHDENENADARRLSDEHDEAELREFYEDHPPVEDAPLLPRDDAPRLLPENGMVSLSVTLASPI